MENYAVSYERFVHSIERRTGLSQGFVDKKLRLADEEVEGGTEKGGKALRWTGECVGAF